MAEIDRLQERLAALAATLAGPAMVSVTQAAAAPFLAEAQRRVPVRTGHLRDRLAMHSHATATHATTTIEVESSGPGGDAHEAVFVEFGTVKMAAQPFLRPAAAASQQAVATTFQSALAGLLKDFQ